jgi:repressor LexA
MKQMTDEELTPRQVQMLRAITEHRSRDGYSPTIGELGAQLNISRTTAFEHIEHLRRKGFVSGRPGRARCLNLTSRARRALRELAKQPVNSAADKSGGIPLAGMVAAGEPIEAVENRDKLSINSVFGTGQEVFALEVRGDSMTGENIREGDYIICRRSSSATDGQLVVAIVDNENATLKRFYREGRRARLQPANEDYEPIYTNNCRIEGVVIGLVRKL